LTVPRGLVVALALSAVLIGSFAEGAQACTRIPAASGAPVALVESRHGGSSSQRSTLRVCVGSKRVVLRTGVVHRLGGHHAYGREIGAASAAGRHVAWIESDMSDAGREVLVELVDVSRRGAVHRLRRTAVWRDDAHVSLPLGVVVTTAGELAWLVGRDDHGGPVVLQRSNGRRKTLADDGLEYLGLEDGRTLRWFGERQGAEYFDLRHVACPSRSRFAPILSAGSIVLTRAIYSGGPSGGSDLGTAVVRGCDSATGHDRVLAEMELGYVPTGEIQAIAIGGPWALLELSSVDESGDCPSVSLVTVNVDTGREPSTTYISRADCRGSGFAPPSPSSAAAITAAGAFAWTVEQPGQPTLLASVHGVVRVLDTGGPITGLTATGATVTWIDNGVPHSATLE
jgi:hypothetical protein